MYPLTQVRDPLDTVISGYLYHRGDKELVWTDSAFCSWDLCSFEDARFAGRNLSAMRDFQTVVMSCWRCGETCETCEC